jgi:hypothetical protein
VDFPPEKKAEDSYDLETIGEIFQKLFGYDEVDPEHTVEVKRIMGIKPEASPYARLAEVYAIGSEEEEKTTPHLSCEINGVQCKALCDIGAQVSVLPSKIYEKVQDHNLYLAPTSMKLIMGDGRTIRPLGIACNMNVKISRKCIPTDFLVIYAYHSNNDHIILGRPFLKLVDAVLDARKGKATMNLNGKKYTYNFLRVSKHPTPFPPEDEVEEVDSLCFVETLRDPLQKVMENLVNDQQDEELEEATKGLEPQDGSVEEERFVDERRRMLWKCMSFASIKGDTCCLGASPLSQQKETLTIYVHLLCLEQRRCMLSRCVIISYDLRQHSIIPVKMSKGFDHLVHEECGSTITNAVQRIRVETSFQ